MPTTFSRRRVAVGLARSHPTTTKIGKKICALGADDAVGVMLGIQRFLMIVNTSPRPAIWTLTSGAGPTTFVSLAIGLAAPVRELLQPINALKLREGKP